MPRARLAEGEYFHVFNRGVEKRLIFHDDYDRWRFLTLLIVLQGDVVFPQIGRVVKLVKHWMFDGEEFRDIFKRQYVEVVAFCLMPNHFHLILHEIKKGGISKFMQRLLNAYTKYFNTKYNRAGHLFGGKFQSVHIDNNAYLNYLSAYIHLNPRELKGWYRKEIKYHWSSFQDFAVHNRFGKFLNPSIILGQFNKKEYKIFVEETPIKEIEENVDDKSLFN